MLQSQLYYSELQDVDLELCFLGDQVLLTVRNWSTPHQPVRLASLVTIIHECRRNNFLISKNGLETTNLESSLLDWREA